MELEEFRARVLETFGEDLHRASPASVREFFEQIQFEESIKVGEDRSYLIEENAKTYEEVMRTFFARTLEMPAEVAVRQLWMVAFELAYTVIASADADRFDQLFRGMEDPIG
jgi:hypothetical protein